MLKIVYSIIESMGNMEGEKAYGKAFLIISICGLFLGFFLCGILIILFLKFLIEDNLDNERISFLAIGAIGLTFGYLLMFWIESNRRYKKKRK